jgi:Gpi18-like mannosyltransferase
MSRAHASLFPLQVFTVCVFAALACALVWRLRIYRWGRDSFTGWATPLVAFAVTRLAVVIIVYVAPLLVPPPRGAPPHLFPAVGNRLIDALGTQWDSFWYLSIASEGYSQSAVARPGKFHSTGFFPLLPVLVRAGEPLAGNAVVAGLILAHLSLGVAATLLYRLVAEADGAPTARRAVWYFLLFPTAFFGSTVYSEPLFLAAAVAALYTARRGWWESAALLGIIAALARPFGIIVAPTMALEWWQQRRLRPEQDRPTRAALWAAAVVPLGSLAYMLYTLHAFGDPFAYWQEHLNRFRLEQPGRSISQIAALFHGPVGGWDASFLALDLWLRGWANFLALLAFAGLGLALFSMRMWSEAIFVLGGVALAVAGELHGHLRYAWVLFPAYHVLAHWGSKPWFHRLVIVAFGVGFVFLTAIYVCGHYVA